MGKTIRHEVRGCLFVWDAEKAAINVKKHRVSFQAACEVFFDPFYLMMQDIGEHGEDRRIIIGQSYMAHPMHPVCVVAVENEANVWRIISARLATQSERRYYARKDLDIG